MQRLSSASLSERSEQYEMERAEVFLLCARRRRRRIPSAQDRAPLSWTNERADMLFVCE